MNPELLKSDEHGRVRTPRERREQLVDEFERCGTSAAAFARIVGVKYQTFIRWVHLRRLERSSAMTSSESGALGFVEAVAASGVHGGAGLRVELPGGARMEIHAPHQISLAAELLRALASQGGRGC